MNINEMNLAQLSELRKSLLTQRADCLKINETLLADSCTNEIRHIDTRIEFLKNKHIWDMV